MSPGPSAFGLSLWCPLVLRILVQDEMATVTRDVTRDQASWRRREEDLNAKYNDLRAAYGREVKLREKLEEDINELEAQEREAVEALLRLGSV